MKILFMGDVVGKPGLLAIRSLLPKLINRHRIDLAIANAENSEGGAGVSADSAEALLACEVNLLTSGNHIWSKQQIIPWMVSHSDLLLRPANYPKGAPGKGHAVAQTADGRKLGVINLEGRVFMKNLDETGRSRSFSLKPSSRRLSKGFSGRFSASGFTRAMV